MRAPLLFLKDPEIIKQITIKDFEYFVDRNPAKFNAVKKTNQKADKILMEQMTSAQGDTWKSIRSTFTPIFTSGKMKAMMVYVQETCKRLTDALDELAEKNEEFEGDDESNSLESGEELSIYDSNSVQSFFLIINSSTKTVYMT